LVYSAATTSAHRIIYNNVTGILTYDSNGSLAGGAIAFAKLSSGLQPVLTAGSFQII